MTTLRAPVVTDADREWSAAQCPAWAVRGFPPDDGKPVRVLFWDWFVSDQAERFERFFCHERKTPGDWCRLWRKSWWPKADPVKLFPKLVPKADRRPHPFFRSGTPEFARALEVATARERWLWRRIGVAQFVPDDPRVKCVQTSEARAI